MRELNLSRDIKGNKKKKSSCRNVDDKMKTRENVEFLQKETRDVVTRKMEKAEVVDDIFALVLSCKWSSHTVRVTEGKGGDWENVGVPAAGSQVQLADPS